MRPAAGWERSAAGKNDSIGRPQGRGRLAQNPSGQQVTVAKGRRVVEQHQVEVPVQPKMLETVVQYDHIRLEPSDSSHCGTVAVFTDQNRYGQQGPGEHLGFISGLPGI